MQEEIIETKDAVAEVATENKQQLKPLTDFYIIGWWLMKVVDVQYKAYNKSSGTLKLLIEPQTQDNKFVWKYKELSFYVSAIKGTQDFEQYKKGPMAGQYMLQGELNLNYSLKTITGEWFKTRDALDMLFADLSTNEAIDRFISEVKHIAMNQTAWFRMVVNKKQGNVPFDKFITDRHKITSAFIETDDFKELEEKVKASMIKAGYFFTDYKPTIMTKAVAEREFDLAPFNEPVTAAQNTAITETQIKTDDVFGISETIDDLPF